MVSIASQKDRHFQVGQKTLGSILIFLLAGFTTSVAGQNIIDYLGYRITSSVPRASNNSVVVIKKGRRTLAKHSEGLAQNYASHVELVSVIGSRSKQLVVSQYTGGNHCCTRYWIYELTPKFTLLFESKRFDTIGYSETEKLFQNLDNDKELEIVDRTPVFHYFNELSFVSSPVPRLIFDYNRRTRQFELANRRFSSLLLREQDDYIARTASIRDSNTQQYRVDAFAIFLDFIYAGREQAAWRYYRGERLFSKTGKYLHDESSIRKTLRAEPAYRTIYRK